MQGRAEAAAAQSALQACLEQTMHSRRSLAPMKAVTVQCPSHEEDKRIGGKGCAFLIAAAFGPFRHFRAHPYRQLNQDTMT